MKTAVFFSLALIFSTTVAIAQTAVSPDVSTGAKTNELRLNVSDANFAAEMESKNKVVFKSVTASLNGSPEEKASLETRGQSCLLAHRKCFELKLESEGVKFKGEGHLSGKHFNLVSMWQDKGYISSKLGFEIYRQLGLFELKTEYAEVFLNGQSIGLYMVTDKPTKAVSKLVPNDDPLFIGRRRVSGTLVNHSKPEVTSRPMMAAYDGFRRDINQASGTQLLELLDKQMNLDHYMGWLAINSLLLNGDYSDEIFVFADAKSSNPVKFDIFPWDFDDIFKAPHWGDPNQIHKADIQNSLLYSWEAPIDVKIGSDPVVYKAFQARTDALLKTKATPELLKSVIDSVRQSLLPYLDRASVLDQGKFDAAKRPYTKKEILDLLDSRLKTMIDRRQVLLSKTTAEFTPHPQALAPKVTASK